MVLQKIHHTAYGIEIFHTVCIGLYDAIETLQYLVGSPKFIINFTSNRLLSIKNLGNNKKY